MERLLADPGIVRHRGKIAATIGNARSYLEIEAREGFSAFLWSRVGGAPIQNGFATLGEVPAETELSRRISKDLKARGFRFVGPTIVYAHMQATGMVNDHLVDCPRHAAVAALAVAQLGLGISSDRFWGFTAALVLFFTAFNLLEATLPSLISKVAPVDAKGTAMGVYSTSQFAGAFVGGSLAPLGGQNFLEPLTGGLIPTIGPSWTTFNWVDRELFDKGLVRVADNWRHAADALLETMAERLDREDVLSRLDRYLAERRGGTAIAVEAIEDLLRDHQSTTRRSGCC